LTIVCLHWRRISWNDKRAESELYYAKIISLGWINWTCWCYMQCRRQRFKITYAISCTHLHNETIFEFRKWSFLVWLSIPLDNIFMNSVEAKTEILGVTLSRQRFIPSPKLTVVAYIKLSIYLITAVIRYIDIQARPLGRGP